ncbi:LysR family transcriptional regulator [Xylanimonas allomyrinae]|uniref:LysR family transcriptional regulator n=1 Tax=Xylanimonas allomyrinae TaxID=2509459 RepID=A0A4P6EQJ0_9MICO|nr:LysR family transcriptional regulator [Xylanimonas allomyrinae]QAY62557.1 LysR family transcriptional regulator [Xylanimonas allomyrinae]
MDLRGLAALIAVADAGSVTLAAATLGYTQSAVSRQLAGLERSVGMQLTVRVRGGLALTPGGEALVPVAREIVRLWERRAAPQEAAPAVR